MKKLNLTDTILDKLGFGEYWDEDGDWGGRTLRFSNGTKFRIAEYDEKDDTTDGYGNGEYQSHHFSFSGWFAIPKTNAKDYELFFLHEMQVCIKECYPDCLEEFIGKCKKLKMDSYLIK